MDRSRVKQPGHPLVARALGHLWQDWSRPRPLALDSPLLMLRIRSVVRGTPVPYAAHTRSDATLRIARLGSRCEAPLLLATISAHEQEGLYDRWSGVRWRDIGLIDTSALAPGLHRLTLSSKEGEFHAALFVRAAAAAPVALISSTHTWDTYNAFGGLSNYIDKESPLPLRPFAIGCRALRARVPTMGDSYPVIPLPASRPNSRISFDLEGALDLPESPYSSHLVRAEWPTLAWFERRALPATAWAQEDWDEGLVPDSTPLLIFHAHSEYWTRLGVERLRRALERGTSVLFLSGNNLWQWLEPYEGGKRVGALIDATEGRRLIGTAYHRMDTNTSAPYRLRAPEHPIFRGLPTPTGMLFGAESSNTLGAVHDRAGASAHEIDVVGPGGGAFELLASGTNRIVGASMVARSLPGGGWVFNASSTGFTGVLLRDSFVDGLLENLVADALSAPSSSVSLRAASTRVAGDLQETL